MEQDDTGPIRAEASLEHVDPKTIDVVDESRADSGRKDRRAVRRGFRSLHHRADAGGDDGRREDGSKTLQHPTPCH